MVMLLHHRFLSNIFLFSVNSLISDAIRLDIYLPGLSTLFINKHFISTKLLINFGPLFLTFTLTKWSGKPLLEKGLKKSRPGYDDYVERTSGFFPWPPHTH